MDSRLEKSKQLANDPNYQQWKRQYLKDHNDLRVLLSQSQINEITNQISELILATSPLWDKHKQEHATIKEQFYISGTDSIATVTFTWDINKKPKGMKV